MAELPKKSNTRVSDTGSENCSVDEMLNRLKKGAPQQQQSNNSRQGELITREDGTQVIKVRRRKRRSTQAPKTKSSHSKTNPKLKWILLGTLVAFLILSVVATIFIIAKYNGRKFKATTESTISALSGANTTTLNQLRVTPVSAKASRTELTWGAHSFLKDASFTNARAHIKATSFFSSHWIGEEIVASKGVVHLQTPSSPPINTLESPSSPYLFGAYRCNQLDLIFGSGKKSPIIKNLMVSLRQLRNEQYQIVFQNGTLNLKNWPKMKLSSGIVTLNSDSANIEALLKAGNSLNGELTIKGQIANNAEKKATLSVKAKSYPIEELLGKDLGRLIKGELQGDSGLFSYDYSKEPEQALSFILPFNSTDIRCEGFPMFKQLSKLIGNTAYARPTFPRARGTLIRTNEDLSLNDLELINNSLMLIHGNLSVSAKGRLSGTLTIGIPETVFDDRPPAAFTGPRSGFYHIDVQLNGTVETPNDTLHTQLKGMKSKRPKKTLVTPQDFIPPSNDSGHQVPPIEADFNDLTR